VRVLHYSVLTHATLGGPACAQLFKTTQRCDRNRLPSRSSYTAGLCPLRLARAPSATYLRPSSHFLLGPASSRWKYGSSPADPVWADPHARVSSLPFLPLSAVHGACSLPPRLAGGAEVPGGRQSRAFARARPLTPSAGFFTVLACARLGPGNGCSGWSTRMGVLS